MSEPVQSNQPASTSDDAATLSDAVAQVDAAVPAADLDAALAEVDKMQTATPDGGDAGSSQAVSPDLTVGGDNSGGIDTSTPAVEPAPSQEQLDDIARQVEATVFGGGADAVDSTTSAQPILNSTTTSPDLNSLNNQPIVSSIATQSSPPVLPTRPVAPAPILPSFLPTVPPSPAVSTPLSYSPTPVAANSTGVPSLAQPPVGQAPLGAPGYNGGSNFGSPYGAPPGNMGQPGQQMQGQFGAPGQPPQQFAQQPGGNQAWQPQQNGMQPQANQPFVVQPSQWQTQPNQQPGQPIQSTVQPLATPQPLVQALAPGTVISGPGSTPPQTAIPAPMSPSPPAVPVAPIKPGVGGQTYSSMIDVLTDLKLLSEEKLGQLKQEFLTTGRNYEDIVAEKKWLSEEGLTKAKAKLNNLPYITIGETGISPEALSKLDESVARRYGILPFAIDKIDRKLSVAMKNPLDIQAIAFVEQKTGFKLAVHYASPSEIERVIVERYAQNLSTEVNEALKDTDQTKVRHVEQDDQLNNFGGVIRDAPINRIVETILEFAVKSRASDIHIEPLPNKIRVRYRIDGILVEKLVLPRSVIDAVVSRIKILGNMKIDEKRIPQDGRFNYTNDVKNVDLRVSTIPTVNGEKVNMRLLEKNLNVPTLEDLGLHGMALANVKESIKVPHGIILISGPTGSGKTTTLYSLINILNTPKVNIVTLEDPVEYQMIGVNQVQINTKAGLTFATGLRAFLRQDPNVIMVGEMRDRETTELAIQASLTGHLVFSTIHTSSAATSLPRMTDMGAESFLIASSVTLIIAQRVVRKINPTYKEEYVPDPAVIADIQRVLGVHFDNWCMEHGKTPQTLTLFRPSANRPENEPEYLGRMAIYEVMKMNEAIGRMILQNRPASEMEQEALRNGMLLMKQDGYIKVLEGITTIEEILRVADV